MAIKFNGAYHPEPITHKAIDSHVQLSEVKQNLHFDEPTEAHDDDSQIKILIEAAAEAARNYCGQFFALTQCTQNIYNFNGSRLKINAVPLDKINSITADGSTLTADTDYTIMKFYDHFIIYFESTQSPDALIIKFTCGYQSADLPARVRQWVIVEASDGYDTDRSNYAFQVNRTELKERCLNAYIIK